MALTLIVSWKPVIISVIVSLKMKHVDRVIIEISLRTSDKDGYSVLKGQYHHDQQGMESES